MNKYLYNKIYIFIFGILTYSNRQLDSPLVFMISLFEFENNQFIFNYLIIKYNWYN